MQNCNRLRRNALHVQGHPNSHFSRKCPHDGHSHPRYFDLVEIASTGVDHLQLVFSLLPLLHSCSRYIAFSHMQKRDHAIVARVESRHTLRSTNGAGRTGGEPPNLRRSTASMGNAAEDCRTNPLHFYGRVSVGMPSGRSRRLQHRNPANDLSTILRSEWLSLQAGNS